MKKPASRSEPVALPDEVLRRGHRWARLADQQAAGVARFGRTGLVALLTLVACLASLLMNTVIVFVIWGADDLMTPANWLLPVAIPGVLVPVMATTFMNLLDHMRDLSLGYRYLAEHDALTGAHNRNGLYNLAEGLTPDTLVVLADIDQFKHVNDELGHGAGDRILLAVVDRIRDTFGAEAVIARVGGDEFVVLIPPESSEGLEVPDELQVTSEHTAVRVSLGSARLQGPLDEAISEADLAMYRAKPSTSQAFHVLPRLDAEHLGPQGSAT